MALFPHRFTAFQLRSAAWLLGLLTGQAGEPKFYRAVNLHGPAAMLDGNAWEGEGAAKLETKGQPFENQETPLHPETDAIRSQMLRSSLIGQEVDVTFTDMPDGKYLVYLHLWEDNDEEHLKLLVNDAVVVADFPSGHHGDWKKLGPWSAQPAAGKITVSSRGGTANLSGVEIWSAPEPTPEELQALAAAKLVKEQSLAKAREWWSLRPLTRPEIPSVQDAAWSDQPLDRFILAKLEAQGLRPGPPAERPALLRRATYDLTGLPPTPEELQAFVDDATPDAFAKVVDRLLASPRYGERWGRHWLDVVRYADSAGDNSDFPIPQMHLYRDWVIAAFNQDLPYDQFVRQQLAGDLLPEWKPEHLIATGYLANARRFGSRVDDYPTHLTIEDTLDNFGRAFLGLTINCARCHDHKFDPISTEDYYALYGIFNSTRYPWPGIELEQRQRDLVPLVPPDQFAEADQRKKENEANIAKLDEGVKRLKEVLDKTPEALKATVEKAFHEAEKIVGDEKVKTQPYQLAYAMSEQPNPGDVNVQLKGNPAQIGARVRRHFLTVLGGTELPAEERGSGRLQLADWVLDASNPLPARVMANRLWLHHFGKGLVPTANDFGKHGKPPTHPELLDWLAVNFREGGWSIKAMHRTLMLSRTYQLSSTRLPEAEVKDTNNELLSSFPRRRLQGEELRDTLLTLSGALDLSPPGPHPFPPQSEWKFTQHNPFKAVYETNQRSVYLMTQRTQRHPFLAIFDGADPSVSTPQRPTSTTPLQALFLLNDPFLHEQSRRFAERLLNEFPTDSDRLQRLYQLALSRPAQLDEIDAGRQFLGQVREKLTAENTPADQLESATWQALVRVTFRLNEFVYLD